MFMAQVDVVEVTKDAVVASSVSSLGKSSSNVSRSTGGIIRAISGVTSSKGTEVKKLRAGSEAAKGDKLFYKLAEMFYDRFKKEDVIDARRKADFVENGIPNAPPLTRDESNQIRKSMELVKELSKAKRIAGTVKDSVEKYLHHPGQVEAGWGMSVTKIDAPAVVLFTELWLHNTYARKNAGEALQGA